ncbi:MAG: GNAT family N-acetyltransferase [Caulobacterales bacterium]|jgi:GNAT superfamily N-acetyltransferase
MPASQVLRRIANSHDPLFEPVSEIYEQALPARERKPRAAFAALLDRPDYRLIGMVDDGAAVGFALVYLGADIALLEYMATHEALRGRGLGAELCQAVQALAGARPILIEVDSDRDHAAPDLDVRRRRKAFYRRCGAREISGLAYQLPLPGLGAAPAMDLMLLNGPPTIAKADLALWLAAIYADVYGQSPVDPRIAAMLDGLPNPAAAV